MTKSAGGRDLDAHHFSAGMARNTPPGILPSEINWTWAASDRKRRYALDEVGPVQASARKRETPLTLPVAGSACILELVSCSAWAWVELNYRPHAYQACALTN